ncbi:MAG TPA: ribonuclease Z, partial [Candidatus Ozemobacteraceae bacterium]|nr:ribonuclease Z [Candidatus Ozemobacteraceae bacterium]
NKSLRGGLETLEGKLANLTDYFDCRPISINRSFRWETLEFTPVQTVHVVSGMKIQHSYGLLIREDGSERAVFFSTDTQFAPYQMRKILERADLIFHDCETAPFKSGVHAHYDDLKTLPSALKSKIWLYHYQPRPTPNATEDGFLGFVTKGQEFIIEADRRIQPFPPDEGVAKAA